MEILKPSFTSVSCNSTRPTYLETICLDNGHEYHLNLSCDSSFLLILITKSIDNCSKFPDELILPFLWAQDGFSEPSEAMAEAISYGLAAPRRITMIGHQRHLMFGVKLRVISRLLLTLVKLISLNLVCSPQTTLFLS